MLQGYAVNSSRDELAIHWQKGPKITSLLTVWFTIIAASTRFTILELAADCHEPRHNNAAILCDGDIFHLK